MGALLDSTTSGDNDTQGGKAYWIFSLILYALGTLIMTIMTANHFRKWYQDFFTPDRASVKHRREPPKITKYYKIINYLTNGTVLMYLLAMVCGIWGNFTSTKTSCYFADIVFLISYQVAKTQTYCIFLMRLHNVYRLTVYGYSWKWLAGIAGATILISLVIIVGEISSTVASIISYNFAEPAFFCDGVIPVWVIILIGILDVAVSCGFLYGFSHPLKQAVNDYVEKNELSTYLSDRTISKIIFQGMKYKIITAVCVVSTIISLIVGGATGVVFFAIADFIINTICILIMTDYYPDISYYTNLCCCCVKCCDKNEYSKETGWSSRKLDAVGKTEPNSIDTNDALRFIVVPDNDKKDVKKDVQQQVQAEMGRTDNPTDDK